MDVQEFIRKYNIPIEDYGVVENIVDSNLRKAVGTDVISGFEWYLYRSLGILESYPVSRGWTIEECIRDLLQNALDEGKAEIKFDKEGFHIIDHGRGMPLGAFDFGGEKARDPCYRGGFGEGLKIALSTLTLVYDTPVYFVVNDGLAYKSFKYKRFGRESKLYIAVGTTDKKVRPHGTHVIVPIVDKTLFEDLNRVMINPKHEVFVTYKPPLVDRDLTENGTEIKFKGDCMVKYSILDIKDVIYASDLFFTVPSKNDLFRDPTYYGYNLWLTTVDELEPNRKAFTYGGYDKTLAKMCMLLGEAPVDYMLKMLKDAITKLAEDVYYLDPSFVELEKLPIHQCVKTREKFIDAMKQLFDPKKTSVLIYTGNYNLQLILHYKPKDSKVFVIDRRLINWNPKFILKHYKNFEDYVREHLEKVMEKMYANNLNNTRAYDFTRTLLNIMIDAVEGDRNAVDLILTKKPVEDVKGVAELGIKAKIIVPYYNLFGLPDSEELIRLLIHELAHVLPRVSNDFIKWMHYRGYKVSKFVSLEHTDEVYELALQYIAMKLTNIDITKALRRVLIFGITNYESTVEEINNPPIEILVPTDRIFKEIEKEEHAPPSIIEIKIIVPKVFSMMVEWYEKNASQLFGVITDAVTVSMIKDALPYTIKIPKFDSSGNIIGSKRWDNVRLLINDGYQFLPSRQLKVETPLDRKLAENDRKLKELIRKSIKEADESLKEEMKFFLRIPHTSLGLLCMYDELNNKLIVLDIMFSSYDQNKVITAKGGV